ncbi:hypothetical protein SERLADRAFT_413192 [Serpula lacrymans var. lacrymans S7.9]|uniref:Uncharacterized protein n=1 Tax=Serpula lacrymans var. lacrymans (strain S7.9) TaxID=578457 RepID=F8NH31_SERL9|nr:uncharacterized protein SERLADRAFT_413192 [Serpula lacrymans var. lacrymans S7.9]EGO29888.1 hypothetical protein SERLADRAFT_413192 [Serpula lacrymans var. lacrymans S7.9]
MSDNLVVALGPGDKLASITSFAPDYLTVRRAFNELLVFPALEAIGSGDDVNLLTLVTDGTSRFSDLSNIDVDLARKVISYNSIIGLMLDTFSVDSIVMTMQPVAKQYADGARADLEDNMKFFNQRGLANRKTMQFSEYISALNDRVAGLDKRLGELDALIQQQSEALAERSIVDTLWDILKSLYKLASTAEESDVQIASILGVAVTAIYGSFQSLFADTARLQKIISSLKGLRSRTNELKKKFAALSTGLTAVVSSSRALLDVWYDVAARMDAIQSTTDFAPAEQAQEIKDAWAGVAAVAQEYIDVVSQPTTSAADAYRAISTKFNAIPKVPLTADEIRLYKLAVQYGNDTPFAPRYTNIEPVASTSDEATVEKVIGPPVDTEKKLQELADSTGRIINQFNTLLQQAFLDQIKCTSPIDGSESNLFVVINYYREKYLQLQLDTLPVARDLGAYSTLQQTLLPYVVPDNQVKPGDIAMSIYLATNTPLVSEYLVSANELSKRSTQVKNDWDNAINLVKRVIAECDQNIESLNNSINDLTEQQKNATLNAFLYALGAFLAFTAAVFLPGIAALGGMMVWQAIQAAQLTVAINDLRSALHTTESIRDQLFDILPIMDGISLSLSRVSLVWSDITTALTTLDGFYLVLNGATGPLILAALKPGVINNWKLVSEGVEKYIETVSA